MTKNNFNNNWLQYTNTETDKKRILSDNKGKAGIYQWIHNKSGKIYIGSAVNLYKRFILYYSINHLNRYKTMYINNALLTHGYSAFSLRILEYINIVDLSNSEARKLILEREQYYLDLIFSQEKPDTYNVLSEAGSRLGSKHSAEAIAKISAALSGDKHPFFGKSHSIETLAKMSAARSGGHFSGENHPMFGKTHSAETRASMSAARGTTIYVYNAEKSSLINTFSSARKAAEYFNIDKNTILRYAKKGEIYKEWFISLSIIDNK